MKSLAAVRALATTAVLVASSTVSAAAGAAQVTGPVWGTASALITSGQFSGVSGKLYTSLSADGRYAVFTSYEALVPADTNGEADVYLRDVSTGSFLWVSAGPGSRASNGHSSRGGVSPDGRYATFISDSTDLVPDDTNFGRDVFLRDMATGRTTRVNVSSTGEQADQPYQDLFYPYGTPMGPSVSNDGTVVFTTAATNLVPGDTNGVQDLFTHSVRTGMTSRVSLSATDGQLQDGSDSYAMSSNGRCVAFTTAAADVVDGDTNGTLDVFVRDLVAGTTRRASIDSTGRQVAGRSLDPALSGDCRKVAFWSASPRLAGGEAAPGPHAYLRDLVAGTTVEISVGDTGRGGKRPTLNQDGTVATFQSTVDLLSTAPNPDHVNRSYVRNLTTGITKGLVARPNGRIPQSSWPRISADGQHVSFTTGASLLPADVNGPPSSPSHDSYLATAKP